ncbi:unnamed protein product [Meloidogyne enterolobii]|uniref:Uncharacterized protein n=1 Tax=Meloidogyne enterolobii TaxID=390850 RepID=A0ACB0YH26_MELEN
MFSEEETETNKEKGEEETMENRISIAQRMAKMSRKIDKWLKSLDVDEEEKVEEEENFEKIPKSPSFVVEQSLNENSILAAYLDTLSLCISVSAIEQCSITFSQIVEKFSRNEAADIVYFAIKEFMTKERFLPHFSTEDDNSSSSLSANNCYIILVDEEKQKQSENLNDNYESTKTNDTNNKNEKCRPLIPMITIDLPEEEEEEEIIEESILNEDLNKEEQNYEENTQAVLTEVGEVHEESDNSGQTSGADTEGPSSFEEEEYIERQITLVEVHEGEYDDLKEEMSETLAENKAIEISGCLSSEESRHSLKDKKFDEIGENQKEEKQSCSTPTTSSSSTSLADTPVSSLSIQDIIEKVIKEEIGDEKIKEEEEGHLPFKGVDDLEEEIKQNQKNLPCISLISENIFEFKNQKECECNFVLKKEEKEEIIGEFIKEKELIFEEKQELKEIEQKQQTNKEDDLTDWLSQLVAEGTENCVETSKVEEFVIEDGENDLWSMDNNKIEHLVKENEIDETTNIFPTELKQIEGDALENSFSSSSSVDTSLNLKSKEQLNEGDDNILSLKEEEKEEDSFKEKEEDLIPFNINQVVSVVIQPPSPPPRPPLPNLMLKQQTEEIFEENEWQEKEKVLSNISNIETEISGNIEEDRIEEQINKHNDNKIETEEGKGRNNSLTRSSSSTSSADTHISLNESVDEDNKILDDDKLIKNEEFVNEEMKSEIEESPISSSKEEREEIKINEKKNSTPSSGRTSEADNNSLLLSSEKNLEEENKNNSSSISSGKTSSADSLSSLNSISSATSKELIKVKLNEEIEGGPLTSTNFEGNLTKEEIEHIERINKLAEMEGGKIEFMEIGTNKSDQQFNKNNENTLITETNKLISDEKEELKFPKFPFQQFNEDLNKLTEEESKQINLLENQDNKQKDENILLDELTIEEKEHIRRIELLAAKEFNKQEFLEEDKQNSKEFFQIEENPQNFQETIFDPSIDQNKDQTVVGLTFEELEHIQNVLRLAEESGSFDVNLNITGRNGKEINSKMESKPPQQSPSSHKTSSSSETSGADDKSLEKQFSETVEEENNLNGRVEEEGGEEGNNQKDEENVNDEINEEEEEKLQKLKINELFAIKQKEKIFYPSFFVDQQEIHEKQEEIAVQREWSKIRQLTLDSDEKPEIPFWAKNIMEKIIEKQKMKKSNEIIENIKENEGEDEERKEKINKYEEEKIEEFKEEKIEGFKEKDISEAEKQHSSHSSPSTSSGRTSLADSSVSVSSKWEGEPFSGDLPEKEESESFENLNIEEKETNKNNNLQLTKEELEHIAAIEKLANEEGNLQEYLINKENENSNFDEINREMSVNTLATSDADTVLTISSISNKQPEQIESEEDIGIENFTAQKICEDTKVFTQIKEKINVVEEEEKQLDEQLDLNIFPQEYSDGINQIGEDNNNLDYFDWNKVIDGSELSEFNQNEEITGQEIVEEGMGNLEKEFVEEKSENGRNEFVGEEIENIKLGGMMEKEDKMIEERNEEEGFKDDTLNEIDEQNIIKLIDGIETKIIKQSTKLFDKPQFSDSSSSSTTSGADSTHSFAELYTTNQALSMMDSPPQFGKVSAPQLDEFKEIFKEEEFKLKENDNEKLNEKFNKSNTSSSSTTTSEADSINSSRIFNEDNEKINLEKEEIKEEEKSESPKSLTSSTPTSGADSLRSSIFSKNEHIESIEIQSSGINKNLPKEFEGQEFLLKYQIPKQKSVGRCSLQYGSKAVDEVYLAGKRARQSSLTYIPKTMVNYTNMLGGSRFISKTTSISDQSLEKEEEKGGIKIEENKKEKKKFSKIKIVFTDQKLRESFCESYLEEKSKEERVKENVEEEGSEQILMENKKKFDNVDFLIKLDFYAQRLSEEIAEEAVKDIKEIELIRKNPRAVYFDDQFKEYLLQECEEEQEEEEEEEEGLEKKNNEKEKLIEEIGDSVENDDW